MALEASIFTKARIANSEFGATAYTPAETLVVKLFSDLVSLDGIGDEITTAGYIPLSIENNLTNFPTATSGVKENAVQFEMEPFEADSPEIVSIGIFDEDDNLLYRKSFASSPITINATYFLTFAPSDIRLEIQ
ncbi:MAG TPA: hypothetical protein VF556_08500 [Pyrinomonadaceae bacterium]|jgi:hypothetical protein